MQRNLTRIGLVNFILLLLAGAIGFYLAHRGGSLSGQAGMAFLATGLLVAIVSWFQMGLEERERLERLELDELARSAQSATLFGTTESEIFPAQRAREQFERFLVPATTVLLFLMQAGGAVGIWLWLQQELPDAMTRPMLLMALFGMFALVLLLFGKYGVKRAQLEGERLLRPGAAYVLLGAAVCFLVALAIGSYQAGFPRVDLYLARAFSILLGLASVETLVTLVLEVYRPRVKGRIDTRALYESRLVGLLGQPAGLFTTAAQALDYQFGFKVSETWFYQFAQRAAGWIILAQVAVLLLTTCVVFIDTGEEAILERNGRPLPGREVLEPGLHFKLPWPIDAVYRERTREVRRFLVGIVESDEEVESHEEARTILWSVAHAKEEANMLVASRERYVAQDQAPPVGLLTVNIPVQYQIRDLRAWAIEHANATNVLEGIAFRQTTKFLAGVDLLEFMSTGREQAGDALRKQIQDAADAVHLGVEILFVGLQGVHPPVKVGKEFEAVVATLQEKEAIIERARTYALTNVILTRAEATNRVSQAEVARIRQVASTAAEAARFTNQVNAYRQAPEVYMSRAYLGALSRGLAHARKFVITPTNTPSIFNLNLEEMLRPDLLNIQPRTR